MSVLWSIVAIVAVGAVSLGVSVLFGMAAAERVNRERAAEAHEAELDRVRRQRPTGDPRD